MQAAAVGVEVEIIEGEYTGMVGSIIADDGTDFYPLEVMFNHGNSGLVEREYVNVLNKAYRCHVRPFVSQTMSVVLYLGWLAGWLLCCTLAG